MALQIATPAEPEPDLVASREVWRDGAMRIDAAEAFSGLSETELWDLMNAGLIRFFRKGAKKIRMIARASLVDYLAAQEQQDLNKARDGAEAVPRQATRSRR